MGRRRRLLVRLLLVVALLAVAALGAAGWLYRALPRIAAAEIGRWMNARVETGAFHPHRDGSVTVTGLVIRPKQGQALYDNTILRADHVWAKFSRRSLLTLTPRVTAIGIEDFMLDVQLDLNSGQWNIGSLRFNAPHGGGGGDVPVVRLVRGKLRYCKISGIEQEVVMSVPVEVHFERDVNGNPGYSFEIRTSKLSGGYGESRLSGRWQPCVSAAQPGELTVAGGLSSTDIPSLERAWAIDILAGVLHYEMDGKYTLDVSLKNLHGKQAPEVDMLRFIAPAASASGPLESVRQFFAEYQPTGTVGSVRIKARGNTGKLNESEIEGKIVCKDISTCDNEFPYRLDHLAGELEFTQSTMRANQLVGRHGPVEVCIDGWTKEEDAQRQYQYRITSRNMILDKDLYNALNAEQKRLWDTFQPSGKVAVDYRLARTVATGKRLFLSVDLNDVTAAFKTFPYPLAGLTGNLFFDRESVTLADVVSRAAGREIRINGKVTERASGKPVYYLSIDGKDIPLDATLRDVLPAQHRTLFGQFDINGLADVHARVFSTSDANAVAPPQALVVEDPNQGKPAGAAAATPARRVSFLAEVSCKKTSLKLPCVARESVRPEPAGPPAGATAAKLPVEKQPLVLSDVAAQVTITPESMNIRKLEGRQGRSPVEMNGTILFGEGKNPGSGAQGRNTASGDLSAPRSVALGGSFQQCLLKITARQVPVDERTIGLLPASLARQVAALHPEGDVDLAVDVKKTDSNELPEYAVVVNCLGDKINHERFPYPLQDVCGTVTFAKDRLVLKDITAKPQEDSGQTTEDKGQTAADAKAAMTPSSTPGSPSSALRINGSATLGRGPMQGSFTVQATDLFFTESLGRALPKSLAGLYRELSPQGPFDLDLSSLKVSQDEADGTRVEFTGRAHPKSCRLRISGAPTELAGALEAQGAYSTKRGLERGQARLAAERLVVKGKAVTHADIAAFYDPNAQTWTASNFVGDCYGGKLLASLEVGQASAFAQERPGPTPDPSLSGLEYRLQVALHEVDLQQFLTAGGKTDSADQQIGETELLSFVLRTPTSASSGTMDAALSLTGRIGAPQRQESQAGASRRGICHIRITNMQVGKVSPLGNVLSVLRLSEPTDYAFERMRIDSYVRGDKLLVSKLDLSGRNAAFTGAGTMNLATEDINLTLTARGSRFATAVPSVLQSLTEGLGGAVIRMEVTGKAGSPRIQTKTLPVIEDSLRLLGTSDDKK